MSIRRTALATIVALGMCAVARAQPVTTAMTYQGQLKDNGQPETGPVNVVFRLFDAQTNGTQIGPSITLWNYSGFDDTGRFTESLDFGTNAFDGTMRWLEIQVDGVTLNPRQRLNATPFALYALNGDGPWALNGDEAYYNGGDVGIGTTNPISRLHVVGNMRASGTVLSSRVSAYQIDDSAVLIAHNDGDGDAGVFKAHDGAAVAAYTIGSGNGWAGFFAGRSWFGNDVFGFEPHPTATLVVESDGHHYVNMLGDDSSATGILFGKPSLGTAAGGVIFNSPANPDGLHLRTGGNTTQMSIRNDGQVIFERDGTSPVWAYGSVDWDGTILNASDNVVAVSNPWEGFFDITFNQSYVNSQFVANVTHTGLGPVMITAQAASNGKLRVAIWDADTDSTNSSFDFVIFRP